MVSGAAPVDDLQLEYQALRDEILSNSQLSAQVFTVSITAVGAFIGFGMETENWLLFVSAYAILLPSLWFVSSQVEATVRIGSYIRVFHEWSRADFNWETRLGSLRLSQRISDTRYTISITGIYGVLGVACLGLAWYFKPRGTDGTILLAIATVVLIVAGSVLSRQVTRALANADRYVDAWEAVRSAERGQSSE